MSGMESTNRLKRKNEDAMYARGKRRRETR